VLIFVTCAQAVLELKYG